MFATVFSEKIPFLYKITEAGQFSFYTNKEFTKLSFDQIFTRKEYDYLKGLGSNLDLSIDFGIWGVIAIPILRGLQFFYTVFPNYGIAIILLTIIIRLLTFPLQYKSFKSMKKMQEIQPQLNKVREKFKDNPQKMQQETMALFKKSGANPLGGCLPLILQMPIFFAFYRVLYSSVELVDAPFYLWISDLSQKDPFYVLPILMAVAMVLNQRLMPTTTTDPVQKKIMMFVPLIFAIFMKDFPAGLTLYIFISTLVGMLQQLYVYRRA
jgi:YidC/Oxa1 family membrane protein insertase